MLQKVVNKLFRKAVKNSDGTVGYSMSMEKTIGTSLGGAFAISDYNESRDNGNGVISSALLAAGNFALSNMVGMPAYMAMSLAQPLAEGTVGALDAIQSYGRNLDRESMQKPFANSTFVDTQQTYTMRQAGMNLARQGQYAMQQAMLGDEARMTYR